MEQKNYVGAIKDPELYERVKARLAGTAAMSNDERYGQFLNYAIDTITKYPIRVDKFDPAQFAKFCQEELLISYYCLTVGESRPNFNNTLDEYINNEERKNLLKASKQSIKQNKPKWFDEYLASFSNSLGYRAVCGGVDFLCENQLLRGSSTIFMHPNNPIENQALLAVQEEMKTKYQTCFYDLNNSESNDIYKSNIAIDLFIKPFEPTQLEENYHYVAKQETTIKNLLANENLSDNDNGYCEQALIDLQCFKDYLIAQMSTLVSFEPQATFEDVDRTYNLFPEPRNNNLRNNLCKLDKTSLKKINDMLNRSSDKQKTVKFIQKVLLASDKNIEINYQELDQNDIKKTRLIPYDINSRFREMLDDPCLMNLKLASPMSKPFCKILYTDQAPKLLKDIELKKEQIKKIGVAILPSTKEKKSKLQEELTALNNKKEHISDLINQLSDKLNEYKVYNPDIETQIHQLANSEIFSGQQDMLAEIVLNDPTGLLLKNMCELSQTHLRDNHKLDIIKGTIYPLSQMCPDGAFPAEISKTLQSNESAITRLENTLKSQIQNSGPLKELAKINQQNKNQQRNISA